MQYQITFKRYELKYMLTKEQKALCLSVMEPYMRLDKYGHTTIRNVYYDTDNYYLIRNSIEKPIYKEKLRIRSYHQVQPEEPVFIELKKKYQSVVYKRRLALPELQVMDSLQENAPLPIQSQIATEIDTFRNFYKGLKASVFLSYEREAYYDLDGSDFRITFDENILARTEDMTLTSDIGGTPLLPENFSLMEIKTSGGMPLWLSHFLNENKIYKTSFSKYGTAYQTIIFNMKGEKLYA